MKTNHRSSISLFLTLAIAAGGSVACNPIRTVEPRAGMTVYEMNYLDAYDPVSMDVAWSATRQAVNRLGFATVQTNFNQHRSHLIARTHANQKVEIYLSTDADPLLRTRIYVDTLGDESMARLVLEQIRQRHAATASANVAPAN